MCNKVMDNAIQHPDRARLESFGSGLLRPEEMAEIEGHLCACPQCRRAIDVMPGDDLIIRFRRALLPLSDDLLAVSGEMALEDGAMHGEERNDFAVPEPFRGYTRFEIIGELGRGGMGVVYKAKDKRVGDRVIALKTIRPDLPQDPEQLVRRFMQEIALMSQLQDEHIVVLHDADKIDGTPFLVMEYVRGTDLGKWVEQHGPLSSADACEVGIQAATGLHRAYEQIREASRLHRASEQGLAHRDITPRNLMWTPEKRVKILDFGIARVIMSQGDTTSQVTGLTAQNMIIGNPDYMAPEQFVNPSAATDKSDVYSLGCTLYYLLTGEPPFPGGSIMDKSRRHQDETPGRLAEIVPSELNQLLARMMAKNPADRPQTGEVATELRRIANETVGPPPVTPPVRRRSWLAAIMALAVLLAGGSIAVMISQKHGLDEEGAIAELLRLGGHVERGGNSGSSAIKVDLSPARATGDTLKLLKPLTQLQSLNLANVQVADADLAQLKGLRQLQELILHDTPVGDAGLGHLEGLTALGILDLHRTRVSDTGLAHLRGMSQLRSLNLRGTEVTGSGLAHLKGLRQLEWLDLRDSSVNDAGLEPLRDLTALTELELSENTITDKGLSNLKGLTRLYKLGLFNTAVTDAGMEHLKGAKRLRMLDLGRTRVGNAGLQHLKELSRLQLLDLFHTRVSDAGLNSLKGLTQLRKIDLRETQVTGAGIDELKRELPDLEVGPIQ